MKRGTTPTLEIKLELNATDVTNVYFTFKEKVEDSDEFLLQKNYPEDATYDDENEVFLLPLTQEDTLALTDTYFLEAEVVIGGKSVIKSDIGKEIMQPTLYTEVISGNESNGNNETITLSFTDYIKQEGGGSSDYNDLSHKPRFNGIEWVGNKTDSDMGIATKGELQTKADKSDTYTKEETNTFLNAKQDTVSGGNGVKIENDEISVNLQDSTDNALSFIDEKLRASYSEMGYNDSLRDSLAQQTGGNTALASKSYVDNLMSGATKWEFVSQLPTEDIDIHTIYFVPKQDAETDNIYDEWVYAIQSRNPDVYDWELLGTNQVDLTNYYTKTESDNKYQPIIDSTHKVSADNIDDSTSTNKFVRIIQSTNTPPSSSGTKYEVGTIWQKYSSSAFELRNLTNVYVCKGHSTFVFSPIDYQWEDITDHYSKSETDTLLQAKANTTDVYTKSATDTLLGGKQNALTVGNGIDITSDTISAKVKSNDYILSSADGLYIDISGLGLAEYFRQQLASNTTQYALATKADLSSKQDTIDTTHKLSSDLVDDTNSTNKFVPTVASADYGKYLHNNNGTLEWSSVSGGGSYSGGDGIDITNDTISVDLKSGSKLQFDNGELDVDLSSKEDKTTISTDTSSTTVSLTLADNHEYRYTQDLASLTLTMPNGDFISSIVFASGSTPTSMTYDSSIKWSGDDVTNGQFVPSADKDYDIMMYYNGLNINGIVRGA